MAVCNDVHIDVRAKFWGIFVRNALTKNPVWEGDDSGLVTSEIFTEIVISYWKWRRVKWMTVFQCLAGQAPSYLSDDCQPVSDSRLRRLRSSDSLSCVVRRAHNTYGDRCFATAGPRVWNSLPAELQQCSSLRQLKRCLKTFLFRSWDYGALWLFVNQRRIEIVLLTYLLNCEHDGSGFALRNDRFFTHAYSRANPYWV